MITAFKASYIKFQNESLNRLGNYCVIEIIPKGQTIIKLLIIDETGLVMAEKIANFTVIKGYHHFITLGVNTQSFGVGGLEALFTKDNDGMLEGLAKQMNFEYAVLAKAFGEGILRL